ncbi:hypothetical protein PHIM7_190 [Sinorhizobium phage phiM7]|nr:hypothetical protein AB690_gp310 [Sinorhizobium phage phiM12]YP_009601315.1 hypothetical protein FDH46_gp288 [Sinorhizobium phage phiM7]AGR47895.1 hypothetical protein SmphiM12_263 [Sinorhizobium phage phiM12]AKF12735.1 hypothetical protein PHIM7_190 [Sinorhizobium phage phiM7]AKF13095.1 hypothetical protein PHIM19_190 [Sinorhizobium phage phiM19]
MSRKFEYEYEEFDAEEYNRGRKLNKNAHREQRRARDNSRYAFDTNFNDADDNYDYY